jgi:hypothetical protein
VPSGIIYSMPSWRNSASQQCQDDLDGLLNMTLPFARQMVEKEGEFFPFGAVMSTGGKAGLLGADPGQGEPPASAAVLATMLGGIRDHRASYRAVATCFDVRLPDSDAVRFELEHHEGPVMAVFLPYKKRIGRGVDDGDLRLAAAERQVWA